MQENYFKPKNNIYQQHYDYIFCGVGAAASLLLMQLHKNNQLNDKQILLIDPDNKRKKDKTFCFWADDGEPITVDLKNLISHRWEHVWLPDGNIQSLKPLQYNHVASIDLYNKIHQLTLQYGWHKIIGSVDDIQTNNDGICAIMGEHNIQAKYIFDSRPPEYNPSKAEDIHIFQSFVGWIINTENNIFNPNTFRFMDFNINQQDSTQFIYVLPFSEDTALVEVTRFGAHIIEKESCEIILHQYIQEKFGGYAINDIEIGCIPMSNVSINRVQLPGVISLGARNYQIKPSSGYAFKNMYYQSCDIAQALKNNQSVAGFNKSELAVKSGRFAFYDNLLLDILKNNPAKGKPIFEALLANTEIKKILNFLDEKTNLKNDIFIFMRLPWGIFIKTLLKRWLNTRWFNPLILTLVACLLLLLGNHSNLQNYVAYLLIFIGMVAVGIPHGAVDHLLESGKWLPKATPMFIAKYLLLAAGMFFLWYAHSSLALLFFLLYSAWHFGQADGKHWLLPKLISMLWGMFVLFFILGTHLQETNQVLQIISNLHMQIKCSTWLLIPWLALAFFKKDISFLLTLFWLFLSAYLPLFISFSLYFIGQHSITGWNDIKKHLNISNRQMWLHALPFHAAAWIFFLCFVIIFSSTHFIQEQNLWSIFFVFISGISFPHVIFMNYVYMRKK